ncbi:MAG: hypothetical protein JWM59_878 [Verrucomicrobiales bacterium]|nr:hypothetical protein [Verrucomicrobiales bacterium]
MIVLQPISKLQARAILHLTPVLAGQPNAQDTLDGCSVIFQAGWVAVAGKAALPCPAGNGAGCV